MEYMKRHHSALTSWADIWEEAKKMDDTINGMLDARIVIDKLNERLNMKNPTLPRCTCDEVICNGPDQYIDVHVADIAPHVNDEGRKYVREYLRTKTTAIDAMLKGEHFRRPRKKLEQQGFSGLKRSIYRKRSHNKNKPRIQACYKASSCEDRTCPYYHNHDVKEYSPEVMVQNMVVAKNHKKPCYNSRYDDRTETVDEPSASTHYTYHDNCIPVCNPVYTPVYTHGYEYSYINNNATNSYHASEIPRDYHRDRNVCYNRLRFDDNNYHHYREVTANAVYWRIGY